MNKAEKKKENKKNLVWEKIKGYSAWMYACKFFYFILFCWIWRMRKREETMGMNSEWEKEREKKKSHKIFVRYACVGSKRFVGEGRKKKEETRRELRSGRENMSSKGSLRYLFERIERERGKEEIRNDRVEKKQEREQAPNSTDVGRITKTSRYQGG